MISCGSEDGRIFIWHINLRRPVKVFNAGKSSVNCVSWHPTKANILAAALDDNLVQIWGTEKINNLGMQ